MKGAEIKDPVEPAAVGMGETSSRSDLSDAFLHRCLGDEAVDHHLLVLTDTVGSAKGLRGRETREVRANGARQSHVHRKNQ